VRVRGAVVVVVPAPLVATEATDMTLVEFLLARIAEDEHVARHGRGCIVADSPVGPYVAYDFDRVLAECEAKRRIVALHANLLASYRGGDHLAKCATCSDDVADWPCPTLRHLALPYADHSDYQPEWTP
jgi:hypothetical protein